MTRLFAFSFLVLVLAGCSTATPTPIPGKVDGAGDAAVELIQQQMYHNLTQQAIENQRIQQGAQATATQMVVNATATHQQRQVDDRATERAYDSTQQAWSVTVEAQKARDTETAQAKQTATRQAQLDKTATIEARQTSQAAELTEQAPLIAAKAEAIRMETQKAQMELDKAMATMWFSAWGPWILAILVVLVAVFIVWKKSQVGIIPTDQNGRSQTVVINQGGQKVFLNPNLMGAPAILIGKDSIAQPMLVDQQFQERVTHGAQVVEAVKSLPPGYNRQALGLTGGLNGSQNGTQINVQVVQPGQLGPVLDEVEGGLLDAE